VEWIERLGEHYGARAGAAIFIVAYLGRSTPRKRAGVSAFSGVVASRPVGPNGAARSSRLGCC